MAPANAVFFLVCICTVPYLCTSSWLQQRGDQSSTSYVQFTGEFKANWRYITLPTQADYISCSPCVGDDGTIFLPLGPDVFSVSPSGDSKNFTLLSVSSRGTGASNCVYSSLHNLVIFSLYNGPYYTPGPWFSRVAAMSHSLNNVVWKHDIHNVTLSSPVVLSQQEDIVFVGGGNLYALNISNGEMLWELSYKQLNGSVSEIKIGTIPTWKGDTEILVVHTHFDDPSGGFHLTGLIPSSGHVVWSTHFQTDDQVPVTLSISLQGVVFGSSGYVDITEDYHHVFSVNASTGAVLYSSIGYCFSYLFSNYAGKWPTVDQDGLAYYSCGDHLFSMNAYGILQWRSRKLEAQNLYNVPASISRKGMIYFFPSGSSKVYVISAKDGSIVRSLNIKADSLSTPIIMGESFLYIIGKLNSSVAVYPLSIS